MIIKINNVAKVIEANIDMKGISVIAGYNNYGKSSILKAIYIGINTFRNSNSKILEERLLSLKLIINRFEGHFDKHGYDYLPADLLDGFYTLISNHLTDLLSNNDRHDLLDKLFVESLAPYADLIKDSKNDYIYKEGFFKPIYTEIEEILNRSKEAYSKYLGEVYIKNTFNNQFNNIYDSTSARIDINSENGNNFIIVENEKIIDLSDASIAEPDAIYLQTYNSLDIVSRTLIQKKYSPEAELKKLLLAPEESETYEEFSEISKNISTIKDIIRDVVNGDIEETTGSTFSFRDKESNKTINISNVASGIKNFLIIKKLVENGSIRKNSILLIDEPESNLHPEWHLIFAEILVLLYKDMGVISVINSHSPYFIRAIEVSMANHGIKSKGKFYLMEQKNKNQFIATDVTNETNKIYEKLYKPLEYL